jgi:hypothetical protein
LQELKFTEKNKEMNEPVKIVTQGSLYSESKIVAFYLDSKITALDSESTIWGENSKFNRALILLVHFWRDCLG